MGCGIEVKVPVSGDITVDSITLNDLTANRSVFTNGSKVLSTGSIEVPASDTMVIPKVYNSTGTNSSFGYQALDAITTGTSNTGIGYDSLTNTTDGVSNTGLGRNSLKTNTGDKNTAVGRGSLESNTSGEENTSIGQLALFTNTVNSYSTAIGSLALYLTTGGQNTSIGVASGYNTSTGTQNTYIGRSAGRNVETGSSNVFIGSGAGYTSQTVDVENSIGIGKDVYTTASNQIAIGNSDTTETLLQGNIGVDTDSPSVQIHVVSSTPIVRVDEDGTNYTDLNQGVWMYGDHTVWEDLRVPLTQTKVGANALPHFDETNVGYLFPQDDTAEILYTIVQMPHSWAEGTDISPHIHWEQSASDNVTWKIDYKWIDVGETTPAGFTTLTLDTLVKTYSSGDLHQISNGSDISGSGHTISSILLIKLYRDDNVYSGDALTWEIDFHYQVDSLGSRQEYVK